MTNRDTMEPVPDGKVRIWDFMAHGTCPSELLADRTPIATAAAAIHGYPAATLAYETRGYVPAGSCLRWQESRWSVTYWATDGTRHGRNFLDESPAREYFAQLTDPEKVSARRQHDARLEDTVYRPAREMKAAEHAERECAKALRAARNRHDRYRTSRTMLTLESAQSAHESAVAAVRHASAKLRA